MATGSPNFAITPNVGAAASTVVNIGDASRASPKSPITIMSAGALGSRIERIDLVAAGPTVASVVRLFLFDGTYYHEYVEVGVPAYAPASGVAAWNYTLEAVTYPNLMPLLLKAGWSLVATINDTQLAQEASITSIAAAQTQTANAYLSLNGGGVTAGNTTAIAAAAAPTANTPMTLTTAPYVATAPAQITITSASNLSTVSYKIIGRDATGAMISETLTGPNATTVYSANIYKAVLGVIPMGTSASTASVGVSPVAGAAALPLPSPIILFSGANLSATTFTITGTSANGQKQIEALSGPNVGYATSVNTYASITSILASATSASNVSVGAPAILGGVSIVPVGGDF